MITALVGLKFVAVYSVAFFIGQFIFMPFKSIQKIMQPMVATAWKDENLEKIDQLYKQSSVTLLIAGTYLLLGIWCNIENILILLPEDYQTVKYVVLVIGLGKLFNMATGVNQDIIATSKAYRWALYFMVFLVAIAIGLNLWLIPIYGILGAALATSVSVILFNTIKLIFIYWKWKLQPINRGFFIVAIIGLVVWGLNLLIPQLGHPILDILIRGGFVTVAFVFPVYFLKISTDVNSAIDIALATIKKAGKS